MSETTEVTLVIRVIRSFPHRNIRNLVMKSVDLSINTETLLHLVKLLVKDGSSLPPPFRKYDYDTLKVEHHAHGAKSNDPVINKEDDEKLVLKEGVRLDEAGIRHETELSLFKLADYQEYKLTGLDGGVKF